MLIASRATAGKAPRCIECGAVAHYIDLNAQWVPSCKCFADLVTKERLEKEVLWAREALAKARARLRKFHAAPTGGRDG